MEKRINHLSQSTDDVRVYVSTYKIGIIMAA